MTTAINTALQTTPTEEPSTDETAQRIRIAKAIRKQSFCVLATTSPNDFPHAAGVVYESVDGAIYFHTMRSSRKARNIAANPRVGVVIPVRKMPVGPPFNVQFQATAELVDMDSGEIVSLIAAGELKSISGHGALEEPDGVFVKITPGRKIHSYGIGVSTVGVIRDPLHYGARSVEWRS